MADPLAITLHASAAETSGGSSTPVDVGALRKCARLRLDVTAVQGTDQVLGVTIETGPSVTGPWRSLGGWSVSGVQSQERLFGELDRYVQVAWTIGGVNPSFTFALAGTAEVLYATPSQVQGSSLPARAMASLDVSQQLDACLSATDEAAGFLARRYTMPLVAWSTDLVRNVCHVAMWNILSARGFQPEGPDEVIRMNVSDARKWLEGVGAGRISPPGIVDSTPTKRGAAPRIASRASRGWDE